MKSVIAIITAILLALCLWTVLLLVIPYSASFGLFLKIALWGIPAYFYPKLMDNANPNDFLLLNQAPQGKWICLSVIFLVPYALFVNGKAEINPISVFYFLSAVVLSPLVEEIAFRGIILQKLNQLLSFKASNVVTTMSFILYHVPLWLARDQSVTIMACLWIAFFSLWMGYFLKSKSLWTCIIVHAVQNLVFGIL